MLLICGGKSLLEREGEDDHYPTVIAVLGDDQQENLPALMANIHDPFVIRLLDKDLLKLLHCPAGRAAIKRT